MSKSNYEGHTRMRGRKPLVLALSAALGSTAAVAASDSTTLEEVLVTARKRVESLQDTPISIQALDSAALQDLGIANFDDYALMLPSLSYQTAGPGLAQLYMRGASDGGDGNASGQQPSVAIYLDEQPVTQIGRNLDLHIYDIARVEALAGPQGTLFGASSQGGTLRIITNKPDPTQFEAGFDLGYADTKDGEDSYSAEGYLNIPLGDQAAIRLVGWDKEDGGYIDNVPGTRTYALFDSAGNTNYVTEDNDHLVKEDINELENTGGRAALGINLGDNWTATASYIAQKQETEGVWFHDPENPNGEVGDLEIQRFNADSSEDDFEQFALTVEGDVGIGTLTYAGSLMDREVEYNNDYSDYSDYYSTSWIQYYSCNYYEYSGQATEDCTSNNIFYNEDNDYDRTTHELRLQGHGEGKWNYIVGFYYEDSSHEYRQEWNMPGMAQGPDFELFGRPGLWYLTDQDREDEQTAIFGEVSYDLTDRLTLLVGGRYFENESTLKGVSGYGAVAPGFPILYVDSKTSDEDAIFKFNANYLLSDSKSVYFTWSEGYRPGGLNRDETALVDREYDPDFLTNWELGWKTMWFDDSLRWNGAGYFMEWEDMQFTKFDSSFGSPVGLTLNIGEAEITGLETDLTWMPAAGWRLAAAFAWNDAELSEDFVIGGNISPKGTELPHVPEFKYNLSARYDFGLGSLDAWGQLVYAYVDESYNDIFKYTGGDTTTDQRKVQDSYDNLNFSAGLGTDRWGVDFYVTNITDERAELTRFTTDYDTSIVTNRPRTYGVKFRMRF